MALRTTVAALFLISICALSAHAFSCAQRDPTAARGADWVVLEGFVESSSPLGARVRVERVYQSLTKRTITVWPGRWAASSYGHPWTFYLQPNPLGYSDPDCGGSHPGNPTAREHEVFGQGRPPDSDEPFLGTVGNGVALAAALLLVLARRRGRPPPARPAAATA